MKAFLQLCVVFAFIFALGHLEIFACTCSLPVYKSEAEWVTKKFNESDLVFVAKVIKVYPQRIKEGKDIIIALEKTFLLKVESYFKNTITGSKFLKLGAGPQDCDVPFKIGQKYLVFAYTQEFYNNKGKIVGKGFGTNNCTRTNLLNDSNEDIKTIKQLLSDK